MNKKISLRDKMRDKMVDRLSGKRFKSGSDYINLNGKKIDFFNPTKEGLYTITILPYEVTGYHLHRIDKGDFWYTRPFLVHKGLGVDGKQTRVCARTFGKKCPICQTYYDNKGNAEYATFKPKKRNLYLVYVEEMAENGVMLYDMPEIWFEESLQSLVKTAQDIRAKELASDNPNEKKIKKADDQIFFYLPDSAYTLQVRLEKKPFKGKDFFCASSITFTEREGIPEEIYEDLLHLDEILVETPVEELEALLYGTPVGDESSESDEEDDLPVTYEAEADEDEKENASPARRGRERKEPEPEEEKKEEPPVSGRRRRGGEVKEEEDTPKCPYGHRFGKDCDTKDECINNCDDETYEACEAKKKGK